jgi:hypothetical protein
VRMLCHRGSLPRSTSGIEGKLIRSVATADAPLLGGLLCGTGRGSAVYGTTRRRGMVASVPLRVMERSVMAN